RPTAPRLPTTPARPGTGPVPHRVDTGRCWAVTGSPVTPQPPVPRSVSPSQRGGTGDVLVTSPVRLRCLGRGRRSPRGVRPDTGERRAERLRTGAALGTD